MTSDTAKPVARLKDGEVVAGRFAAAATDSNSGDSLSMHAEVPVWCDCCSCEAEPYWLEALSKPGDDETGNSG